MQFSPKRERGRNPQWDTGRAPWWDQGGNQRRPLMIGVTGGTASGKTTVCREIIRKLGVPWVMVLSMDSFYRVLSPEEKADVENYNFDHPDAFDWPELIRCIKAISESRSVHLPKYCFKTHGRLPETELVYGADVVFFEGILVLHNKKVRDMLDMKIFVDTAADLRLARRLKRDIAERGRSVDGVLDQYIKTVKPSFDDFILPTNRFADLIIPFGTRNQVAIDVLVEHVRTQLAKRELQSQTLDISPALTPTAADSPDTNSATGQQAKNKAYFVNLTLLTETPYIRHLHTIIRSGESDQVAFQANVHRLSRLLINEALSLFPTKPKVVQREDGSKWYGVERANPLTAVSIVRSGEAVEYALAEMEPDVPIAKIVISKSQIVDHHGPRLYLARMPNDVNEHDVLLMDAVMCTGETILMAIHVLLDHGVSEDRIVLCCLICSPAALHNIARAFPGVRVCSTTIDAADEHANLNPGLGVFGERYFGTDGDYAHSHPLYGSVKQLDGTNINNGNGQSGAHNTALERAEQKLPPTPSLNPLQRKMNDIAAMNLSK